MKCCICGKEIENKGGWAYGNNPDGYVDPKTLKIKKWGPNDRCCDECNEDKVIAGRIMLMKAHKVMEMLDFDEVEDGIAQLRNLNSEDEVSDDMYDFILANWDLLVK